MAQPLPCHASRPDAPAPGRADGWVEWLLETARSRLGMEVAWLSSFAGGEQRLVSATGDLESMNLATGACAPLEGSYCVRVITGQLPPVVTGARRDPRTRDLDITHELGLGSYVGAPVRGADGTPVGMLCCVSRGEGAHLDAGSARTVQLLADLVSEHVRREHAGPGADRSAALRRVRRVLDQAELVTEVQPVVDMATGAVVGHEALTRFPGSGATATVFADAVAAGLGPELERLALRGALTVAPRVAPGRLWVNLSPAALVHGDVVDPLVTHRGGPVGVELTEHTPIEDYAEVVAVTGRLREAGVLLSVDDAGAGYASLSHVLRLRPDVVKLDIGLVSGVDGDPAKKALVAAMAAFAAETGTGLVAEGVERAAERDTLLERGVRLGQGHLLGRPQPPPGW